MHHQVMFYFINDTRYLQEYVSGSRKNALCSFLKAHFSFEVCIWDVKPKNSELQLCFLVQ